MTDEMQLVGLPMETFRRADGSAGVSFGNPAKGPHFQCSVEPEIASYLAALTARVAELEGALELYRDAVQIDPLMEGPRFKGCNLSTLRRAWEADRAALAKKPPDAL